MMSPEHDTIETLHAHIAELQDEIRHLKQENSDLQLLNHTHVVHGDVVAEDLFSIIERNASLYHIQLGRFRQEILALHQKVAELEQEKNDLELLIEMNIEHADSLENDLLHKIESTLRESERRFRLISQTIPVPMIISRLSDHAIVYANTHAVTLFGLSMEALLQHRTSDFFLSEHWQELMKHFFKHDALMNYEIEGRRNDGSSFWGGCYAQSLPYNDDPCLLIAIHDMTRRKEAEEQIRTLNQELERRVEERTAELEAANQALQHSLETLQIAQKQLVQAEKMGALGALVAGVAHEINTPLGIGVTAASYLQQKTVNIRETYEHGQMRRSDFERYLDSTHDSTSMILENLKRAAEQVQSFKQVAVDQTSSEKRSFHLKSYFDDLLLSLHPKFKHTRHEILVQCSEELEMNSYPGALSQIFTNLFMNSLIHGFDDRSKGTIELQVTRERNVVHFLYRDNGKGIAQEHLSRIFEPFYTTKRGKGGTGLGLHIVYNLVTQKFGGSITCHSTPGEHTTFLVHIPMQHNET